MEPWVSLIVPVYNVEPYLKQCLDSILAQTYSRLEIILVEDGSTDGSPSLCDSYRHRDARIQVIHQENRGLSAARNRGLEMATGEYLGFVDADDMLAPEFVERLLNACQNTGAQLALCRFGDCREKLGQGSSRCSVLSGHELSQQLQGNRDGALSVVWNKLYRRELFEGIRFPIGRLHEDEFVVYRLLWAAQRGAVLDQVLYLYRQRPGSIMGSAFSPKRMDAALAYRERILFYEQRGERRLAALATALYCYFLLDYREEIRAALPDASLWEEEACQAYRRVMQSPEIGIKKKAALTLHRFCPKGYHRAKEAWGWRIHH